MLTQTRYMNISLEQTEEFVNGRLRRSYGEAFIRGNNGELQIFSASKFQDSNSATVMYISAA